MAMSNSEPSIAIDCGRRGDTARSVYAKENQRVIGLVLEHRENELGG